MALKAIAAWSISRSRERRSGARSSRSSVRIAFAVFGQLQDRAAHPPAQPDGDQRRHDQADEAEAAATNSRWSWTSTAATEK